MKQFSIYSERIKNAAMTRSRFAMIMAIFIVAGFMMPRSVIAMQISAEKPTSIWDLVRQDKIKKAEPNKPDQPVRTIQMEKPAELAKLAESAKPVEFAKIQQVETQTKERVLHFPKDHSIGQISIQNEKPVGEINSFFYWTEGDRDWESFAQAKGDVKIPIGKRIGLIISKADTSSLSALSKLNPDDLYMLAISGSYPSDQVQRPIPDDKCIAYINHLTGLKDLQLNYTAITAKGFGTLSNLKSLEYLTLSGDITDESLEVISQLRTLKGLYLYNPNLIDNRLTDKGLAYLASLSSLEELRVDSNQFTNAGLAHVAKLTSLRYLMLYGKNFTDAGMEYLKDSQSLRILHVGLLSLTDEALAHIAEIPNLEAINLHRSENITDDGIAALAKLKSLKKLDIGSSKVTDTGLSYLQACKNLDYLTLPPQGISDVGLTYLGQLSNLKHLDVSRVHFVDPKMDSGYYTDNGVAELSKCKLLEELTIGSIGMTDEGMSHIAELTNLKWLGLFGCSNVTNKGIEKLKTLKSLQYLSIYESNITIGGLSSLNELSNLTDLQLQNVQQDNTGLDISKLKNLVDLSITTNRKRIGTEIVYDKLNNSDLACLANLNKLKRLQLPGFGLDDNGLKYFSSLKNLEFLNIYCEGESSITDAGIKHIAGLSNLNRLMIKDGHFTDKSLEYLSGMPALTWLELTSDFAFSNKAIKNFQAKNPNIEHLLLIP
ncbi:MAG: hypothetical protein JW787_11050 [Sedimentisphaerales bacterium]|nr:hypothetical protein [Sedimentisphaerales bacterium]